MLGKREKSNLFPLEFFGSTHYIGYMTGTAKTRTRKKRVDRNHIIYKLQVKSLIYIGITAVVNRSVTRSVKRRWQKHVQRAMAEDKSWKLCAAIRKHGAEAFSVEVVEVVRGKQEAHRVERQLVRALKPKLNSDIRVIKTCT